MTIPTAGFLYIATGEEYLKEALPSVASLKECHPGVHVTLMSDAATLAHLDSPHVFDNVATLRAPVFGFEDKINGMLETPYVKTVFIDTDTRILMALDLERILDVFEMAFCYDPIRHDYHQTDISDAFPTPNTGLIAYRKTAAVLEVLERWKQFYRDQLALPEKPLHDQPAFRRSVYLSQIRFLVLPDEFNLRVIFPHMVGGNTRIKVLHGRHENLARSMAYANTTHFYPRVFGRNFSGREILMMLWWKICERVGLRVRYVRTGVMGKA